MLGVCSLQDVWTTVCINAGSNIFLSSDGSIKLGDFGLSVQLKNYHKTMPNEIKQQVGTVRKTDYDYKFRSIHDNSFFSKQYAINIIC